MHKRDLLTPDEHRELDALERALAGEPVDADLRELEELVLDVRAGAPEMSPAFAARLEHEVAEGFPTPSPRAQRRRPGRWVLLPAAGTLAAVLVALVVVLGQSGGGDTLSDRDAGSDGGDTAVLEDAPAPAPTDQRAARESAPAPPPADTAASDPAPAGTAAPQAALSAPPVRKSSGPRRVERSAVLLLETPARKVEETSDDVIRTVDRFDGIVASSSIGSDDEAGGEATFDLRIPTDRLDEALAALSKLGHVAERRQELEDVTAAFTSVQDRLSDARAERRGLLRALGRATTEARIDSLRARLRATRSTISRLNGDLASLRRRADLSRVSVTVRGAEDNGGGAGGGEWTARDAARDAVRVLEVMAGVALVTLATALPLGLLGLAIALCVRSLRRRDRERALDPA